MPVSVCETQTDNANPQKILRDTAHLRESPPTKAEPVLQAARP
jgi:hypothetical protein